MSPPRVLFVCTGNATRSVIAAALVRRDRPDWQIDSAGTWAIPGLPSSRRTLAALESVGVSAPGHRSTTLTRDHLIDVDLVVGFETLIKLKLEAGPVVKTRERITHRAVKCCGFNVFHHAKRSMREANTLDPDDETTKKRTGQRNQQQTPAQERCRFEGQKRQDLRMERCKETALSGRVEQERTGQHRACQQKSQQAGQHDLTALAQGLDRDINLTPLVLVRLHVSSKPLPFDKPERPSKNRSMTQRD